MNSIKIIKLTTVLVLMASLNLACSGSDVAKEIADELGGGNDALALLAPELNGSYISPCVPDIFGINYRIIEVEINEEDFVYTESSYADSTCTIALNAEPSEMSEGSIKVREELPDEQGFFYEFLIPIDENVSAVRLINIKKIDDESIKISDFFYNDDDFDISGNQPEIFLSAKIL